jgi:hypothetical protein
MLKKALISAAMRARRGANGRRGDNRKNWNGFCSTTDAPSDER